MTDITRQQVIDEIIAHKITTVKGAKLLGISRQRLTEVVKAYKKRAAKAAPAAPPVSSVMDVRKDPPPVASGTDPAQARPAFAPAAPPAEPSSMGDVMKGAEPTQQGATSPPPTTTSPPPPLSAVDPEDIEAGRELIKMLNINVGAWTAKMVYGIKDGDPRLDEFKTPNGFLKVAMKRNGDKAAPVGKLSKGWKGIIIGFLAEAVRIVAAFGMPKPEVEAEGVLVKPAAPAPLPATPAAPQAETPAPAPAPKPAPQVQVPTPAKNVSVQTGTAAPASAHTSPFGEASDLPRGPKRTLQQKIDDEKRARGLM